MKWSEFAKIRAACAYFFICPGLSYGLFTSRLPALKEQTGANEEQIGFLLFCLGVSSLFALFSSGLLISRWGSRMILSFGSFVILVGIMLCGLAINPFTLGAACVIAGLGMGLVDVAMNTQGIQIEHRYATSCMSFMHAAYSIGGVGGAMAGALFASMGLGMFVNAVCVLGLYACFCPWAVPKLLGNISSSTRGKKNVRNHPLPLFVVMCGIFSMLAYAAEGSVAEWGSLLLFTVKGASEATAAFVFAAFSVTTVFGRLFGDRLRSHFGDLILTFTSALFATFGMAIVLFSNTPVICLVGYALMGFGLAPIIPILFSRAGSYPGVSPAKASTVVSIFSYSGLLFFPPLLGFVAQHNGLNNALMGILGVCVIIALGMIILKR